MGVAVPMPGVDVIAAKSTEVAFTYVLDVNTAKIQQDMSNLGLSRLEDVDLSDISIGF
ncbi:hypothetical protein [Litoribacillus peritrichatus]|uniref:Uncharacterized protein n=1 Tax=Litoribacillus peritrichatus TaxID=718191 RepID=A0ABP7MGZ7_9GAMM